MTAHGMVATLRRVESSAGRIDYGTNRRGDRQLRRQWVPDGELRAQKEVDVPFGRTPMPLAVGQRLHRLITGGVDSRGPDARTYAVHLDAIDMNGFSVSVGY